MARTKQTARKFLGGAPRRVLSAKTSRAAIKTYPIYSDEEDYMSEEEVQPPPGLHPYDQRSQSSDREPECVRDEIANILKANPKFEGSFCYQASYEAINPILNFKKVGQIGLPLSKRDAKLVIKQCRPTPFGKGERSVVAKDTWEMDAADANTYFTRSLTSALNIVPCQVQVDNPAWASFLDGVVRSVCSGLGVDYNASRPLCELQKMLLSETGSHFLPRKDTEKADGTFASMIIVLQAAYTGGDVHLSHGGLSSVVDHSEKSLFSTSAMAWFTSVTHEMKPITSGYRLALSYNLIHTTAAARPILPIANPLAPKLRDIFLDWKDNPEGPQKIVYLLEHKYPKDNLQGSLLKGKDATKVGMIDAIAGDTGFNVGLANLECSISGYAEDHTYRCPKRGRWDSDDESDPDTGPNAMHLEMEDEEEIEFSITNLVALSGQKIADTVVCEAGYAYEGESEEPIPARFLEKIKAGGVDDASYDYEVDGVGCLGNWYKRTVLIIWPQSRHEELVYGDKYPQHILSTLKLTDSDKPSEKENRQIEHVLRLASEHSKAVARVDVARTICAVACKWEDHELWSRVVTACGCDSKIADLGLPSIVQAVEAFPWDDILLKIATVVSKERSGTARRGLLDELERLAGDYKDSDASTLRAWVTTQRTLEAKRQKQLKQLKAAAANQPRAPGVKPTSHKAVPMHPLDVKILSSSTRQADKAPAAKRRRT